MSSQRSLDFWLESAALLLKSNDKVGARRLLRKVLKLDPTNIEARKLLDLPPDEDEPGRLSDLKPKGPVPSTVAHNKPDQVPENSSD